MQCCHWTRSYQNASQFNDLLPKTAQDLCFQNGIKAFPWHRVTNRYPFWWQQEWYVRGKIEISIFTHFITELCSPKVKFLPLLARGSTTYVRLVPETSLESVTWKSEDWSGVNVLTNFYQFQNWFWKLAMKTGFVFNDKLFGEPTIYSDHRHIYFPSVNWAWSTEKASAMLSFFSCLDKLVLNIISKQWKSILKDRGIQILHKGRLYLPYARHYNPRFVYFLPTFWKSFIYCDLWPYVW